MAGGKERALRQRIKSVQSTKKITKAMELIAASRIVKARQRVISARPYSDKITEVIRNLAAGGADFDSALLSPRHDVRTVAFVVIAADRGLAGGYNSTVIRTSERAVAAENREGRDTKLIVCGRKAESYFKFRGHQLDAVFKGFSEQPTYEDAKRVGEAVVAMFERGEIDRVQLVYTQFLSAGTQKVRNVQFLPLDVDVLKGGSHSPQALYEFEPSPSAILDRLLPRYVASRLYAAMLDAAASEHANRQRAMKSATENASDLITNLSRVMNRARQDSITTEIMEIVGGAEALRQADNGASDLVTAT